MNPVEPIIVYLRRKLEEAGPQRWPQIAKDAGVALSTPRKIVYDRRENLQLKSAQPLLDYFLSIDRGERELPASDEKARA